MKKNMLSKIKIGDDKRIKGELLRAHIMIGMLSLSLGLLVAVASFEPIELHPLLARIAAALLVSVSLISFSVSYLVGKK